MPSPAPRRPTLQAVARLAEVSHSTVSLILNGRGAELRIPGVTCRKVFKAAETLGYEANYFARSLRGKATSTIAFLWDIDGTLREDSIIRRVTEHALEQDYIAHFFAPLRQDDKLLELLKELAHRQIEGVVFRTANASLLENPEMAQTLRRFRASVVIGQDIPLSHFDAVHHQSGPALAAVAAHLQTSGCQHLGLMQLPERTVSLARKAWAEAGGLWLTAAPLSTAVAPPLQIRQWFEETLANREVPRVDALICHSDVAALIAVHELRSRGFCVPRDIAVIGLGNSEAAACFSPALASIDRRDELVASRAVELLLSRLGQPELPPQSVSVEMKFLPRESAFCLPSSL